VSPFRRPVPLAPVAVLALACSLSACAGSADGAAPSTPSTPAFSVGVHGTSFTGVPSTVHPGAVTMSFTNGTDAVHMAAIARLADGHTASDVPAYLASPAGRTGLPAWLTFVGGVDELDGGHRGSWTGTLTAGRYALVSFSPDAQGRPEVADGMLAPFVVRGEPGPDVQTPATGATVSLGAGGTLTMTSLPTGTAAIRLVNGDTVARTVDITVIRPGRTYDDVMQEAQQGNGVPPSLVRLGGTVVPAHGSAVAGIEPAVAGSTYVVFDIDHVAQGAIAHQTAG
jgi:hypothetical protein